MRESRNLPRILIGAANSGSGKTLFTCGLLSFLKNNNKNVACFKCGPDYIDPMFHKNVLGVNGGNLDTYFCNKETVLEILSQTQGDCVVIEGVMGLYDGLGGVEITASSYDVAVATNTPIVLIVDCHGQARTVISVIRGILEDDTAHLIKGIILNRMTGNLYDSLKPYINDMLREIGVVVQLLGYIPKIKGINLESRHLGLKMPDEIDNIKEQIQIAEESIKKSIDMNALIDIMNGADKVEIKNPHTDISDAELRLAVAIDEAFCFYYEENLNAIRKRGIEIVPFSPIHDKTLPENIHGILLGGGYPELFLYELSSNESMRRSIRKAIDNGIPSLAECGGFMYLHEAIKDEEGASFPMVGCVKGVCSKQERLVRFGYVELQPKEESFIDVLSGIKGHEFHYYDSENNGESVLAIKPVTGKKWNCMHCEEKHIWGFPHLYYESKPKLIGWFEKCMGDWKKNNI